MTDIQSNQSPIHSSATKAEQILELIHTLAHNYREVARGKPGKVLRTTLPGRNLAGSDLDLYEDWLGEAHQYFRQASQQEVSLTYASEWVLDNYHIIRQSLHEIRKDLPPGYYNRLPKLATGPLKNFPRIYCIARDVLSYQRSLLDPLDLQVILIALQKNLVLTTGELWALPIFLRYNLIEVLAHTLEWVIRPQSPPHLPPAAPQLPGMNGLLAEKEPAGQNAPGNDPSGETIANVVLSLRVISEQNWNDFFESVSQLEQILREDPPGIYPLMDFKTRDLYRKEIEVAAFATGHDENELGEMLLDLACHRDPPVHIGEILFGKSRTAWEERMGWRPDLKKTLQSWGSRYVGGLYLASIALPVVLIFAFLLAMLDLPAVLGAILPFSGSARVGLGQWLVLGLLGLALLVPVLTMVTSLVNWLITLLLRPDILPKLDYKGEIPDASRTLLVVPALINSQEEIQSLVDQLELHYLRNPEPGLLFALLTDFRDADSETLPEDEALAQYALAAIAALNIKYEPPEDQPAAGNELAGSQSQGKIKRFYILHRKRLWNPSERKWMGWERKRGKLHELNLLLRKGSGLSFVTLPENLAGLQGVRFVITLDADTILPRGAACHLAGTLAHPLNRAVFDDKTGQVISGYTVLQPRMEIHPRNVNHSWFTRIFAGDTGLDLYSRAVSDAYQDLFGEGSYVGKGIYDVDAFERSVDSYIPENTVLSHDLLEGVLGRAGLVTDITMIEDYPLNYFVQTLRQRRWIRGDWQLLPWLLQPGKLGVTFSLIDRWKLFDNLRRSLLAPDLLFLFFLGMIFLPSLAGFWTAIVLLSFGIPLATGLILSTLQILRGEAPGSAFHSVGLNILRWLLAVAFLPYEAYVALDAIFTTLYRLYISHRDLLQWTTAAQTARLFGMHQRRNDAWQKMWVFALLVPVLVLVVQWAYALTSVGVAPALVYAAPVLLLWILSPLIAWGINRPITTRIEPLSPEQLGLLRQVARRTWGFFERFVGPEDHWLPPDHFQEAPVGIIAHHTSPTNIGLLLTSTLAAYDLGYLDPLGLVTRLATTMDSLAQLERSHGHFLNWYDTLTLQPLQPRYISVVDSGNLAASLIVVAQACKTMPDEAVFRWNLWQGYLDTLSNLTETLTAMRKAEFAGQVEEINQHILEIRAEILAVRAEPERWYGLYRKINGPFWQDLSQRLMELVEVGRSAFDLEALRKLQEVAAQVERLHLAVQRTLTDLIPWIVLLETPPTIFQKPSYVHAFAALRADLPYNPALAQIRIHAEAALLQIEALSEILRHPEPLETEQKRVAWEWVDQLKRALAYSIAGSEMLMERYAQLAVQAEQYVNEMNFRFMYHGQHRVFHLGFNLETGQLDHNYYDLLASEARIASIVAIAKGEVPQSHWMQLSRPITQVEGMRALLSWSATMFEYLMPPLFLRSYAGTLLADSARAAVLHQIAYGKAKGLPWGISESGFYQFDASQNYQYRAFGVPGLGFKRGLGDDLVIAPYASLMAIAYHPPAVARNLSDLIQRNGFGLYGLYEAIDFTTDRLLVGETAAVVQEYMAHHQGMILMAMANFLDEDIMVRRMHADPRIQSIDLLLQEQVPLAIPLQNPYAEDVRGVQRQASPVAEVNPWTVPVQTPIPQMHLLSNGNYSVLISNVGSGYSTWRDIDLTRWQSDRVFDAWGAWVYIQELGEGSNPDALWAATFQPVPDNPSNIQATYFAHMAVFHQIHNGVISTLEVTVPPDDPIEIRRMHLHNGSETSRCLRLTSYGEVILTQQAADARHPAFNKLFIDSEFVPELDLQIFMRRPRSSQEAPIYMGHMLVVKHNPAAQGGYIAVRHEADRGRFIGRGHTLRAPAALNSREYLSGTTGATLDPIFALGQELALRAGEDLDLAYLTFAGESREAIFELARRYRSWTLVEHSFRHADIAAQAWLGKQNYSTQVLQSTLQVLSALLYPFKELRVLPETIAANRLGQPGLWRFGISGDYPILLVELGDPRQVELVREALQVHKFLRSRRFMVDLVILNGQQTDYGAELNGMLYRLVNQINSEQWFNQRGGIFIVYADQMNAEERTLLRTAARVLLTGERGALAGQLPGYSIPVHHLPDLTPTRRGEELDPGETDAGCLAPSGPRQFDNGYGGFSTDGSEYGIELSSGQATPAPWANIIGYPHFGFMVTEAGSQSTWAGNSGENRLTPWSNDPVCDPSGEVLYLRDEETGVVWTPTPFPAGAGQPYRVIHGAGYTRFEHHSHGLRQTLTLFASPEDPVKIIHLKVENTWTHNRRITATQYVEWVLGTSHAASMPYIIPEYDASHECLLATNPYNTEFGKRTAFLAASKAIHGLTADRIEFLGRGGTLAFPAALHRIGLETRITPGEDPCAVLQLHLDLLPGGSEEIYFVMGQGSDKEQALALSEKYHNPAYVGAAWERTRAFWDRLLGAVQVHTPAPATNLILNRWLLYQALSCRVWGRTAFYQSSGAFGFRDQLQDVLAVLAIDPTITRAQLLNAAQHQFEEGDVMHWWHPPSERGVRTRFADDLLWLPYVTALYVEVSGDSGLLAEKIPFVTAPPLNPGENERYSGYPQTSESYSLMEHCRRAIQKGATLGPHGLPLMGSGDWNDGMNRVGEGGRGESVWLGWFLCDVLQRFAGLCEQQGDLETATRYRAQAQGYATAIEQFAWDGAWYRRAYYDDGSPLGSIQEAECQIDSIAQSWAVLSGAGDPQRSRQAMQSVLERLVDSEDRLVKLFTPPFDTTPHDPGYIKGYLPGTRENGGQYTHAATWTAWAFSRLGDGKQLGALFDLLNPIYQADTPAKAAVYRVEPYVICADIYSVPPYLRRGGWTWYTGSAAWMYRLGLEAMLGFRKLGNTLRIAPVIPPEWDGFEITYRFGEAVYQIAVKNPEHVAQGVCEVLLDGKVVADGAIPLSAAGGEHRVSVRMGESEGD
jgi:cyclic beta-1,2-glucan synthetase